MEMKAWEEKLFKDFLKEEIEKEKQGKSEKEKKEIDDKVCMALLSIDCKGLQGIKGK